MKKLFFCFLFLLLFSTSKSQIWCYPGATWYYTDFALGLDGYSKLFYEKDTLINSITCKKISDYYEYNMIFQNVSGYSSPFYSYEQNDVVYLYNNKYGNNKFDTLFNLSANIGDKWRFPLVDSVCPDTSYFISVLNKGTKNINNHNLRWLYVHIKMGPVGSNYKYDTIYERIGFRYDDFIFMDCFAVDESVHGGLRCYSDSTFGSISFFSSVACNYFPSSVNEYENQIKFSIYPNPSAEKIVIESDISNYNILLEIKNSIGSVVKQISSPNNMKNSFEIDVSSLSPGIYFVSISSGNQKGFNKFVKF